MKLTANHVFKVLVPFLREEYKPVFDIWELADVLSLLLSDPGALYTFNNVVEEMSDKLNLDIVDDSKGALKLDAEQSLIAIKSFLDSYYWEKNNTILLRDVVSEIEFLSSRKDFYSTEFWQQWLKSVDYASKFNFS